MASYDVEKLVKLAALKALAEKVKNGYATKTELTQKETALSGRIDAIESVGAEANVINEIKVNGVKQEPADKVVDINVPTTVGELDNDSNFQTDQQVSASIKAAIAETGHASFKKVEQLPEPEIAEENVLYLFKNEETQKYDIYAKIDGSDALERLDDTTVDLNDYVTTEKLTQELAKKAELTHSHTTSDITDLQEALDAKQVKGDYATKTELTSGLTGKAEKEHDHEDATDSKHGYMSVNDKQKLDGIEIAPDEDVDAMLTEVFDAA